MTVTVGAALISCQVRQPAELPSALRYGPTMAGRERPKRSLSGPNLKVIGRVLP